MPKRKNRPPSFDAMVKLFMRQYKIPNKNDVEKIMMRIERLEKIIETTIQIQTNSNKGHSKTSSGKPVKSPGDIVVELIRNFKNGANFSQIQTGTGFEEKKLRNLIYRLNKNGRILRVRQGIYMAIS